MRRVSSMQMPGHGGAGPAKPSSDKHLGEVHVRARTQKSHVESRFETTGPESGKSR